MGKQRMYRSTPEYKAEMIRVRNIVQLANRSQLFRDIRAKLTGKNQDLLEQRYVFYLESSDGNHRIAEKRAIQEILNNFMYRDRTMGGTNESSRVYSLLTGIGRDVLSSMDFSDVEKKINERIADI